MPGINVALTGVTVSVAGAVTAKFSDGENIQYADWDALKSTVEHIDTIGQTCRDILLAKTVRRSPDGANKTNMVGGVCAINCEADVPVVVTYPE